MAKTYTVAEAGQHLPELLTEAAHHPVPITRDDQTVAFLITPERLEELRETWEILANPEAMGAIRKDRTGEGVYYTLEDMDAILVLWTMRLEFEQQVLDFVSSLAPEPRRSIRLGLRALTGGRGNVKH